MMGTIGDPLYYTGCHGRGKLMCNRLLLNMSGEQMLKCTGVRGYMPVVCYWSYSAPTPNTCNSTMISSMWSRIHTSEHEHTVCTSDWDMLDCSIHYGLSCGQNSTPQHQLDSRPLIHIKSMAGRARSNISWFHYFR